MCVLITKERGKKLPSDNILRMCHEANPDGCGFATKDLFFKDLDFKHFLRCLHKYVTDEDECIIHFRYATHGSIKKENCHPFVDKQKGVAFAHNGVLPIRSKNDMTDSEIFFRECFLPTFSKSGWGKETINVIKNAIGGSKFAFITKDGLKTFGEFFKTNGCECRFSNLRWDRRQYVDAKRKFPSIWRYELDF